MADPTQENETKVGKRRLNTLGDVQRALARLALKVERTKSPNLDKANALRAIYQALGAIMQDRRDSAYQKRFKLVWAEYKKQHGLVEQDGAPH